MTKHGHVAPPVGTIYQVRRHGWRADLLDNEYWQVERRTEKPCGCADLSPTPKGSRYSAWSARTSLYVSAESSKMRAYVSARTHTRTCT